MAGNLADELCAGRGVWDAAPWDYSHLVYLSFDREGGGEWTLGAGQAIFLNIRFEWSLFDSRVLELSALQQRSSATPRWSRYDGPDNRIELEVELDFPGDANSSALRFRPDPVSVLHLSSALWLPARFRQLSAPRLFFRAVDAAEEANATVDPLPPSALRDQACTAETTADWLLLLDQWRWHDDERAVRDCLSNAVCAARRTDDFCDCIGVYDDLGWPHDRDDLVEKALAAAESVDELITCSLMTQSTRADDSRRCVARATERARTVTESIRCAQQWHHHGRPNERDRCLAQAESDAWNTSDYLTLASCELAFISPADDTSDAEELPARAKRFGRWMAEAQARAADPQDWMRCADTWCWLLEPSMGMQAGLLRNLTGASNEAVQQCMSAAEAAASTWRERALCALLWSCLAQNPGRATHASLGHVGYLDVAPERTSTREGTGDPNDGDPLWLNVTLIALVITVPIFVAYLWDRWFGVGTP